jgi:hypothetical protein
MSEIDADATSLMSSPIARAKNERAGASQAGEL